MDKIEVYTIKSWIGIHKASVEKELQEIPVEKKEGYFFTEEELKRLISNTWDAGYSKCSQIFSDLQPMDKQQYTDKLFKNKHHG